MQEQTQSQRERQYSGDKPFRFGLPVRILEEPEEAEDAKRQQQESAQREIDDLIAQQSMANSTEEIVLWTRLQFLLAFGGTCALIYSLHLNRTATNAAVKAADAAREALGAERAWLTFRRFEAGTVEGSEIVGVKINKGFLLQLEWTNCGRSPSIRTNIFVTKKVIGRAETIPVFEASEVPADQGYGICGPSMTVWSPTIFLNDEETANFKSKAVRVIVYSKVTYRDTMSPEVVRSTELCAEILYEGEKAVGDSKPVPNIGFYIIGPQNSAH